MRAPCGIEYLPVGPGSARRGVCRVSTTIKDELEPTGSHWRLVEGVTMKDPHRPIFLVAIPLACLSLVALPGLGQNEEQAAADKEKIRNELFMAAEKGDFATVKTLLVTYPEMKKVRREGGWTLLHMAFGSRELVEYLIENGAEIEARSESLWTPLHSQAYKGHMDGVEVLLEHGADIEAKHAYGTTPLLNSIRWDRLDVAKLLVEKGANVNARDTLGRTPLIISAIAGYVELADVFLAGGADIRAKDGNYGRTTLHFAALNGHVNVVAGLLKKGADVNEKDAAGRTPLDYANRYGHEKVARLLKSSGAPGDIDARQFGYTPRLREALKSGEAFAWYIGQIGYAVKTRDHLLVFSYSASGGVVPGEPRLANGHIDLGEIAECDTIVFAAGPDHWNHNPERYSQWQKTHKSIAFVYSFEDKIGRNQRYFKDVEGPQYICVPNGEKKTMKGVNVETVAVSRGSGFLVAADGVTIFFGGNHLLSNDSQRESFHKPIDDLKARNTAIDLLILPGNFLYGRIFPINVEGVDYAVKTLKPRAYLASAGDASTEFVLSEVSAALQKYKDQVRIFCPEHRGDMFILKD